MKKRRKKLDTDDAGMRRTNRQRPDTAVDNDGRRRRELEQKPCKTPSEKCNFVQEFNIMPESHTHIIMPFGGNFVRAKSNECFIAYFRIGWIKRDCPTCHNAHTYTTTMLTRIQLFAKATATNNSFVKDLLSSCVILYPSQLQSVRISFFHRIGVIDDFQVL